MTDRTAPAHVHPATPLIRAVTTIPGLGAFVIVMFTAGSLTVTPRLLWGVVAAFVLIPAVVGGWNVVAWRRLTYWFDDDGDLRVSSGVIVHQERRVQLSRLQAVDIAQPLIARLVRFAALTIEVAGTSDSRVQLAYFPLAQAQALRADIIARAAGMRPDVGEAPSVPISRVPTRRLIASLLARTSTVLLLVLTIAILGATVFFQGWGGLVIALTTGGVPILIVIVEFTLYYGFTIAVGPDGFRLTSGLLQTQTRTVPPGRIQSIDVVEPFLWRRFGWARVRINIAGVGNDEANSQRRETLLTPVAPLHEVYALLARVMPDVDFGALTWQGVPQRVRWRSPIQWRQLGVARTSRTFLVRRGRVTRHRIAIPNARTQSVRLTQGPWERMLTLASMHVDTTPGPVRVTASHRPLDEAVQLVTQQQAAAKAARSVDEATHWMRQARPADVQHVTPDHV